MPHLFAGLIASGLVAAVLLVSEAAAVHVEHTTIRASAPELFSLKNQGLAFQRAAARAPYVLASQASSTSTIFQTGPLPTGLPAACVEAMHRFAA